MTPCFSPSSGPDDLSSCAGTCCPHSSLILHMHVSAWCLLVISISLLTCTLGSCIAFFKSINIPCLLQPCQTLSESNPFSVCLHPSWALWTSSAFVYLFFVNLIKHCNRFTSRLSPGALSHQCLGDQPLETEWSLEVSCSLVFPVSCWRSVRLENSVAYVGFSLFNA